MGLYSTLQFLPSHMMLTFEEALYLGFFEHAGMSAVVSSLVIDCAARYAAFQEIEGNFPHYIYVSK